MNREEFWKIRSSDEFLRFLCNEKTSNFEKIKVEEEWFDSDGTGHRRVVYTGCTYLHSSLYSSVSGHVCSPQVV